MKKIIIVLVILFVASIAGGEVLFHDNFDSQADWSPTQPLSGFVDSGDDPSVGPGYSYTGPTGYGFWWMDRTYFTTPLNNTMNINSTQYMGASGKSFVYWSESNGGGSLWGSDALLIVTLDEAGYDELYVEYYIKFQSDWLWDTDEDVIQKFFRIQHWTGNASIVEQQANNRPGVYMDLTAFPGLNNINVTSAYRYEVVYFPGIKDNDAIATRTTWTDTGNLGDGDWHKFNYYIKLNSAVGVADGIYTIHLDDVLVTSRTDLTWSDTGASESPRHKFNTVTLGGNNYNRYADVSLEQEQWYAVDNFTISTTPIGEGGGETSVGVGVATTISATGTTTVN